MKALNHLKYQNPTAVQAETITPMLKRKDLLVQAPTGTGKTLAFGIPIIENVNADSKHVEVVIMCPTRELVVQTAAVLKNLCLYRHNVRSLALYGGEPIGKQIQALRRKPQIIIATPGRLLDHIQRRTIRLQQVNTVILDEADRMLDMGFRDDIDLVFQQTAEDRQTVFFSATYSQEIYEIADKYQSHVKHITIKQDQDIQLIKQHYSVIRKNKKLDAVKTLLPMSSSDLALVFVSTKIMADKVADELNGSGYYCGALHGDMNQQQRNAVMQKYRKGKISVLVATDVAARGIDVKNINTVINFDIPDGGDSYTHRIGRTGRSGHEGISHTLIYTSELDKIKKIMHNTKMDIVNYSISGCEQTLDITRQSKNNTSKYKASSYHKRYKNRRSPGSRRSEKIAS